MDKSTVPRLEQIAFQASFKEILSNLVLCPDHCPKDMQLDTVNFVRKRLEYYLVGEMNDKIRYILKKKTTIMLNFIFIFKVNCHLFFAGKCW